MRSLALLAAAVAAPALAQNLPPFDFSNEFYLANGIDPATIIGRPNGSPPGSVIDDRPNGPDLNNVRLLHQGAAYDHSGHPIFFYVTGLPGAASFLANAAGREALAIAEHYNVYEFPRAANGEFSVFPKRQDLVADLRDGYFSNNPLGVWRINLVRFTPAALDTQAGRQTLADLAARNGLNVDGTPLIRTISEIEDLRAAGLVSITIPPSNGGPGVFRWFFCPVIEDPRRGAIAPDAELDVTGGIPAAEEFIALFHCLQTTGDDHCEAAPCSCDFDRDGDAGTDADVEAFFSCMGGSCCTTCQTADFNRDGDAGTDADIESFFRALSGGPC